MLRLVPVLILAIVLATADAERAREGSRMAPSADVSVGERLESLGGVALGASGEICKACGGSWIARRI